MNIKDILYGVDNKIYVVTRLSEDELEVSYEMKEKFLKNLK